ncbi:MAG: hypothetical protein ACYCWK_09385 [Cuniculiplasma sp.]
MIVNNLLIGLTIFLIALTSVLIVLTFFLVYYSAKALRVIGHTDELIKIGIGGAFSWVVELENSCFNNFEELRKQIGLKPEIWTLTEGSEGNFKLSYYLHSESDLEKLLLDYANPECIDTIKKQVSFFRKL